MPSLEKCAHCGEMFSENYGTTQESRCNKCLATERVAQGEVRNRKRESDSAAQRRMGSDWGEVERREQPRVRTTLSGVLTDGAGSQIVRIADVSSGGAMIRGERELAGNGTVELMIAGTSALRARRVWHDGPLAGLMFLEARDEVVARMSEVAPVFEFVLQAS